MPSPPLSSLSAPANRLLAALPPTEYRALLPDLKLVSLEKGDVLYDAGDQIQTVYFPTMGVVSIVAQLKKEQTVEVGIVGREGMVGLATFLGGETSHLKTFVQVRGQALSMNVNAFKSRLRHSAVFSDLLRRFTNFYIMQISYSAACNTQHAIGKRCARWLLSVRDRMGSDSFELTQQYLAQMLGVRRATVAEVAGALQKKGLIDYHYGKIEILNLAGLRAAACTCHAATHAEFNRLFS
jgi:CRP-like cAMP-binding protein